MSALSAVKKDHYEDEGKRLLRKFLFQTSLNLQVKDHFNHTQKIRLHIAHLYRTHISALKGRAEVMDQVFEREIGYLVKQYSKKKKGVVNKKHMRIVAKLGCIDKAVKNRVLCLYMNRMKFYYTIKTLKWFILY